MARKYVQGKFKPKNVSKYRGDPTQIFYRSSWELKFCNWCDNHQDVISWSSETCIVAYISPADAKPHRYYIDFSVRLKDKNGKIKDLLVEIKPEAQCKPPKKPKKQTTGYINEVFTFGINQAKWKAADKFAIQQGKEFVVLTEKHLGIK